MPIYEFVCQACGKEFTLVMHLDAYEKRDFVCTHCGSRDVERHVTTAEVVTSRKS